MDKMLKLVYEDPELVVVEPLAKSDLEVAMNPEFASDDAYYTVTKGKSHVFTVVKEGGTTWSFSVGEGGATLVAESVTRLKKRVLAFILDSNIAIGLKSVAKKATLWDNGVGKVAIRLEGSGNDYDCHEMEGTIDEAKAWVEGYAKKKLSWSYSHRDFGETKSFWSACL